MIKSEVVQHGYYYYYYYYYYYLIYSLVGFCMWLIFFRRVYNWPLFHVPCIEIKVKVRGTFRPRTGREGPEGAYPFFNLGAR
jgi:hypothetical protein